MAAESIVRSPSSRFPRQLRDAGLFRRLAIFTCAHVAEFVLLLGSWRVVGQGTLSGRLDSGWLATWAAMLFCMLPVRRLTTWSQGVLAIGCGGLLRQRLLAGSMRLEPDLVRRHKAGELLGRVVESESLETLALGGGLATLLAAFELILAGALMLFGAAPLLQPSIFVLWLGLTA